MLETLTTSENTTEMRINAMRHLLVKKSSAANQKFAEFKIRADQPRIKREERVHEPSD